MQGQTVRRTTDRISALVDTAIALGLVLFLVGLPFHLVVKKLVPGPAGTYWKEVLLGLLVVLWGVRWVRSRRLPQSGTRRILADDSWGLGKKDLTVIVDRSIMPET